MACVPPSAAGIEKVPQVRTKTKKKAETIEGRTTGKVTFTAVANVPAPLR